MEVKRAGAKKVIYRKCKAFTLVFCITPWNRRVWVLLRVKAGTKEKMEAGTKEKLAYLSALGGTPRAKGDANSRATALR